jgi:hypothetical protein
MGTSEFGRKQQGCPQIYRILERPEEKQGCDHQQGLKSTECFYDLFHSCYPTVVEMASVGEKSN